MSDWLTDMHLISAGRFGEMDGYVGYMEQYATSHQELDEDGAFQQEVVNVATALGRAVKLGRSGRLEDPGAELSDPAPK